MLNLTLLKWHFVETTGFQATNHEPGLIAWPWKILDEEKKNIDFELYSLKNKQTKKHTQSASIWKSILNFPPLSSYFKANTAI